MIPYSWLWSLQGYVTMCKVFNKSSSNRLKVETSITQFHLTVSLPQISNILNVISFRLHIIYLIESNWKRVRFSCRCRFSYVKVYKEILRYLEKKKKKLLGLLCNIIYDTLHNNLYAAWWNSLNEYDIRDS